MKIAVIGSGQMGAGIAQVCAVAGNAVILHDVDSAALARAKTGISRRLERAVSKGTLTAERASAAVDLLIENSDLDGLANLAPELVIEAIPERFEVKLELFQRLDGRLPPTAIFASNTSSISITALAATTQRPDRFIGMHFMNPVPVMELVEIVHGERTAASTIEVIQNLALELGKKPVLVDDQPGFVANRILMPMINEAICALSDGVADVVGIDTVMMLGMNHPMGPLTLADFIGLDTCLSIMEVLHTGYGDPKYRPAPLLRRMVVAGRLGRKAGEGFYAYNPQGEQGKALR